MADLGKNLRGFWLKSMEAIGNTASSIASSTKSKVDEMNLVNRRTEILKEFGNQAYLLWQRGERFPEALESQLRELEKLDEQLNDLRAERLAGVKTETEEAEKAEEAETEEEVEEAADAEDADEAEEGDEEEEPEEEETPVPVIQVDTPDTAEKPRSDLSSAINDLFEKVPTAQEAGEKIEGALDSLQDGLKQVSDQLDEGIDDLTRKITGDDN